MFISAVELASLQLPKLPSSRQGIEYHAKKNNWPFEEVAGQSRGGKLKKYLVSGLPLEIQTAIQEKQAAQLLAHVPNVPAVRQEEAKPAKSGRKMQQLGLLNPDESLTRLDDKQTETAHARCAIVGHVLPLYELAGMPIKKAVAFVVAEAAAGRLPEDIAKLIPIANARSNDDRSLSEPTLYRWVRAYRAAPDSVARLMALAPVKTRKKTPLLNINWLPVFLGFYQQPNKPTMMAAAKKLAQWYLEQGKPDEMPSYDQIQTVMQRLPPVIKERGRRTGSAFKQLLPYIDRDWSVLKPNDVWVGDGHSFKAKVQHPVHGQPFVPEFTAIVDGCSGLIVGWSVSLAENTVAVADALRHGMSQYGVPLIYYSDNGAGQTAKMLDNDVTGILPRLGVEHGTGIPGNPQGRARIERLWGTTAIPLAKEYATYQGKDADKETLRKISNALTSVFKAEAAGKVLTDEQLAVKKKLPTFKQFLDDLDAMVREYNFNHEHTGLPKKPDGKHFTPAEYYAYRIETAKEESSRFEITRLTELELDFMFRPEERRTAERGKVRLFNNHYTHDALLAYEGQEVRIGYDLHNADWVLIKDLDGNPICKAQCGGNTREAFPVARIEQLRDQRKQRKIKKAETQIALAEMEALPAIPNNPDYGDFLKLKIPGGEQVEVEDAPKPKGGKKKLRDFLWEDAS
ncbi:Mu transposase C-terminal domain-containing protein [Neisseria dumasiana]|uniref:Transposase n=1 Tax=Neisseria dumasiana TaxID=1931275 RepID=A0A1X3DL43_9NEIS|nr:Mu transposase C-terminal domain-containing protein [Neisseria dumasiana]OSI25093.1 transposase [Neisseria dumasiana]